MDKRVGSLNPSLHLYDLVTGNNILSNDSPKSSPESSGESKINVGSCKASLERYEDEWKSIQVTAGSPDILKHRAYTCSLRSSRFRSIYWRLFLKLLHEDPKLWLSDTNNQRRLFKNMVQEWDGTPWVADSNNHSTDNPLSQEQGSAWCKYFCDEELRAIIRQDVIRTFPGIDFFRGQKIQDAMVKILFLYARSNSRLCYRQGMHEVLAPILFVLHCDHEAYLHALELGNVPEDLAVLLQPDCLAADAFVIFQRVMTHLESSYAVPKHYISMGSMPCNTSNSSPCHVITEVSKEDAPKCEAEVVQRLESIRAILLSSADPDLMNHLHRLDIPLQLFGIRWLRLLFGREFPLQDLLVLWDAIFATEDLYIVDYIVVAMLVAIRHLLLGRDYTSCLSSLMRYPSGVDVSFILQQAFHLRNPSIHAAPPTPPCPIPDVKGRGKPTLPFIRATSFENRSKPTNWLPKKSQLALGHSTEKESAPGDGFKLEDPIRLKSELEHLKAVMSVVRIKVVQYQAILQEVVYSSGNIEVIQALEGLHELCYLMDTPVQNSVDIDSATEAGEVVDVIGPSSPSPSEAAAETALQLTQATADQQMKVFKESIGNDDPIVGAPMPDPLRLTLGVTSNLKKT